MGRDVSDSDNIYGQVKSSVMPEKWQGTKILMGGQFAYMTIQKAKPACTNWHFKSICYVQESSQGLFQMSEPWAPGK